VHCGEGGRQVRERVAFSFFNVFLLGFCLINFLKSMFRTFAVCFSLHNKCSLILYSLSIATSHSYNLRTDIGSSVPLSLPARVFLFHSNFRFESAARFYPILPKVIILKSDSL